MGRDEINVGMGREGIHTDRTETGERRGHSLVIVVHQRADPALSGFGNGSLGKSGNLGSPRWVLAARPVPAQLCEPFPSHRVPGSPEHLVLSIPVLQPGPAGGSGCWRGWSTLGISIPSRAGIRGAWFLCPANKNCSSGAEKEPWINIPLPAWMRHSLPSSRTGSAGGGRTHRNFKAGCAAQIQLIL